MVVCGSAMPLSPPRKSHDDSLHLPPDKDRSDAVLSVPSAMSHHLPGASSPVAESKTPAFRLGDSTPREWDDLAKLRTNDTEQQTNSASIECASDAKKRELYGAENAEKQKEDDGRGVGHGDANESENMNETENEGGNAADDGYSPISEQELEVVAPPKNFAMVEPGLYRSSLPGPDSGSGTGMKSSSSSGRKESNMSSRTTSKSKSKSTTIPKSPTFPSQLSFLRPLNLRTAVILSSEKPVRSVSSLFSGVGTRVVHTGLHGWSLVDGTTSWKPIADEVVKETIELILDDDNYPILLCDIGGVYNVGMVVACLRRLQGWNLTSVINEYRTFAASRSRYVNEQFIELFDIDLITVPRSPPFWFVNLARFDAYDFDQFSFLVNQQCVDDSGSLIVDKQSQQCCHHCQPQPDGLASSTTGHPDPTNPSASSPSPTASSSPSRPPSSIPRYRVDYYSSSSPLNSGFKKAEPRIQRM